MRGSSGITNTQRSGHKSHWTSDVSLPKVSFLRKTSSNSTTAFRRFYELGYCYIGIDLDLSKPKGMPLGLKLHTYSFTTKYINIAKA